MCIAPSCEGSVRLIAATEYQPNQMAVCMLKSTGFVFSVIIVKQPTALDQTEFFDTEQGFGEIAVC